VFRRGKLIIILTCCSPFAGAGPAPHKPPPLECRVFFWLYLVFEAVGYGEIQRDTARYS